MKSILIIGLGRFGRHMARKFIEEGNSVLAVDINEERVNSVLGYVRNAQIGDASDAEFMGSLGIDNFDIVVVAIGDNFLKALETTVLAADYGAKYIIARATRDVHRKLLLRNGANYVVYAERDIAEQLAIKYGAKNVFDHFELNDEYAIYEIATPAGWKGKTILEKNVRAKCGLDILAVRIGDELIPQPGANYVFKPDEKLIVMGKEENVKKVLKQ